MIQMLKGDILRETAESQQNMKTPKRKARPINPTPPAFGKLFAASASYHCSYEIFR